MPTSRRQSIIDAVKTRFQGINGAGNYNLDVSSKVYVWRPLPVQKWEITELPAINVKDGKSTTQQHTTSKHLHELTITVEGGVSHDTDPAAEARKLIADIITAIGVDRTWGGIAYDTDPTGDEMDVLQEGDLIAGVRVTFTIKYRTANFDPYTA